MLKTSISLQKKNNCVEVYQPSTGLTPEKINQIQRYLDAVRTNLLFAKGVILVEGDAEEILIPIMVKKVLGVSLDELGISLINIRSTGFENVAQLFHDNRIKRKCGILTDLDDAICDTAIIAGDSEAVQKYKRKVAASLKTGLERKAKLDAFAAGNDWIKVFYAKYTFEVDFVSEGNGWEVKRIVKQVYTDLDTIDQAKLDIEDDDVAVYGKRVLTMAKQEGKGWFAIMLGKNISYKTVIPGYIIDAILFAKDTYSNNIVADIIEYRLNKKFEDDATLDFTACRETLKKYRTDEETLNDLAFDLDLVVPDDQIQILIDKLK
jgi:hypothetical protein